MLSQDQQLYSYIIEYENLSLLLDIEAFLRIDRYLAASFGCINAEHIERP